MNAEKHGDEILISGPKCVFEQIEVYFVKHSQLSILVCL